MARTTITRTITTTHIYYSVVEINNGELVEYKQPRLSVIGKVDMAQATKLVHKEVGKQTVVIVRELETTEQLYEISLDDFLKYATPVEREVE